MKAGIIYCLLLVMVLFSSCRKDNELENETLVGKWKLVQMFDGFVDGGNFTWTFVEKPKEIQFFANGNYTETTNEMGIVKICNGKYQISSGNKLFIASSCNAHTEPLILSKQLRSDIIIDKTVSEGVIREKYIRIEENK